MNFQGKTILVTRAKAEASALSLQIEEYGGTPIQMPLIACKAVDDKTAIHEAIHQLHTYDWLVLTSKNGIDFFFEELKTVTGYFQLPHSCKIAVVGKKTEEALTKYGHKADLIPEKFVAESLLESLLNVVQKEERVLIPRGNLARDVIPNGLKDNGILVKELDVYQTVLDETAKDDLYQLLKTNQIDFVTFTSSSTVDNFVQILEGSDWRKHLGQVLFVSIGPITTKTMKKHSLPVHVEAKQFTIQGMLESIMDKLKEE